MKNIVLVVLMNACCVLVVAQQASIWTLEDCITWAVENSYSVKVEQTYVSDAKVDYKESILSYVPSVDLGVGLESNYGRGIDPATNTYVSNKNMSNSARLSGYVPLFSGLQLLNRATMAKIARTRCLKAVDLAKDEVALEVMRLYANALYNLHLVDLHTVMVEKYVLEEKLYARREELGSVSEGDLIQMRARLAKERLARMEAEHNYDISIFILQDAMNYSGGSFLLDTTLYEQSEEVLVRCSIDSSDIDRLDDMPILATKLMQVEERKKFLAINRGSYYPSLSFSGGLSTAFFMPLGGGSYMPYLDQLKNNFGGYIGLTLSVPLFNGWSRRSMVARAKTSLKRAELNYLNERRIVERDFRLAVMELNASVLLCKERETNLDYQRLANMMVRKQYEGGIGSVIDVHSADGDLFLAEIDFYKANLEYLIKAKELEYYRGGALY